MIGGVGGGETKKTLCRERKCSLQSVKYLLTGFYGKMFANPWSKAVIFNWGKFYPPRDIWLCLKTFLIVTLGR